MYRMRQRKLYTVYSMHELCYCTGWCTEDNSKEECTARNDNVNVQDEAKKTVHCVQYAWIKLLYWLKHRR